MEKNDNQTDGLGFGDSGWSGRKGSRGAFTSDKLREAIAKKTCAAARLKHAETRIGGVLKSIEKNSLKKLLNVLKIVKKHRAIMLDGKRYSEQDAKNLVQELEDVLVEETQDDSGGHGLPGGHVDKPE